MDRAERNELRRFGVLGGLAIAVVPGLVIAWLRDHPLPVWPWAAGAALALCGTLYPAALKYPYALWNALGRMLGRINSHLVLAVLFYLVVTPMGLMMRLLGRDPMARKFDPGAQTYRIPSRRAPIHSLERPF
jgi:hypothetical protein